MRWTTWFLLALLLFLQYPLWLSKGGWLRVWQLEEEIAATRSDNLKLEQRNAAIYEQVRDLRQGKDALEEQARQELNMIKPGEIFVQIQPLQQQD